MCYYALDGSIPKHRKVCEVLLSKTGCSGCHAGGILQGTLVETNCGSIDISQVKAGDYLATFEHGMQPVVDVSTSTAWTSNAICTKAFWPFYVPEMVLDNSQPVIIMPEHQVLFNSDILMEETGNPYALVPITALEDFCGIHKIVPTKRVLSYNVKFAKTELLILNGGTILNCKADTDFMNEIIHPSHSLRSFGTGETKALLAKIEARAELSDQLSDLEATG